MQAQPALFYLPYLPPIGWIKEWLNHPAKLLEKEENFVKSTYRNRCEIAGPNGKQILSIPLQGGRDHHQMYKDVRISYHTPWQRQHWQSIRTAYGSAPFYEHYAHRLQPFYEKQYPFLFEYNLELLQAVLRIIQPQGIVSIQTTTSYQKQPTGITDLRHAATTGATTPAPTYHQVFEDRYGFIPNLSIIDYLFCEGR